MWDSSIARHPLHLTDTKEIPTGLNDRELSKELQHGHGYQCGDLCRGLWQPQFLKIELRRLWDGINYRVKRSQVQSQAQKHVDLQRLKLVLQSGSIPKISQTYQPAEKQNPKVTLPVHRAAAPWAQLHWDRLLSPAVRYEVSASLGKPQKFSNFWMFQLFNGSLFNRI